MFNYSFEVTGTGHFPYEILSYGFWPASNFDAERLNRNGEKRTIKLLGRVAPNKDTWLSYGWSCFFKEFCSKEDYNSYHTWPC
tara:strand:- start:867 stop:1115 length:249 start_codon:yes stop_codon:yes gene_type:complete